MIRSSLHPAPALVLALAVGGSLAYLWNGPEEGAYAAPSHAEEPEPLDATEDAELDRDAAHDVELDAPPD